MNIVCVCVFDSRHDDDAKVEPVPGVPQEGEGSHTETPRQDLYERLECIDTCEGIPERVGGMKREREGIKRNRSKKNKVNNGEGRGTKNSGEINGNKGGRRQKQREEREKEERDREGREQRQMLGEKC